MQVQMSAGPAMSPREAFEAWAPPGVEWSAWCKPTLFVRSAQPSMPGARAIGAMPPGGAPPIPVSPLEPSQPGITSNADGSYAASDDYGWPRAIPKHCALILEMPGPRAVEAGVSLRDRGYWPVPLFNATPGPNALIDVGATARALMAAAPALAARPPQAGDGLLPCFLIDEGRCPKGLVGTPGRYDNRSIVFPQDFPSATRLRARGVESVLVVRHTLETAGVAPDLAHVLYGWQRDGLRILTMTPRVNAEKCQPTTVSKPSGFGLAMRRILTFAGLRRSAAGGFGAFMPEASSGSGYS